MKLSADEKLKLEELLDKYHFKKSLVNNFKIQPKTERYCVFDDMYETKTYYSYSLRKLGIQWETSEFIPIDRALDSLECSLSRIQYDAKYDDAREHSYKITKIEDVLRKLNKTEKKLLKEYYKK